MGSAAQSRVATPEADSAVPPWHERNGAGEEAMLRMDGVSGSRHPRTFVPRCGEKAGSCKLAHHSLPRPRAHVLPCPFPSVSSAIQPGAWGETRFVEHDFETQANSFICCLDGETQSRFNIGKQSLLDGVRSDTSAS